jgi:type III secretion system HrpB2-like protein
MTAAISAIGSVESVVEAAHKSVSSPASEQLTEKFAALMQAPGGAAATPPMSAAEPSSLMRVMESQEAMFKQTVSDLNSFQARADTMSVGEATAEQMRLTMELAVSSVHFTFGSQVASESNKGLQTLLKNQ